MKVVTDVCVYLLRHLHTNIIFIFIASKQTAKNTEKEDAHENMRG